MRRLALLTAAVVGLAFPAGLGLAVYLASGSTLAPPATARVPTGTIARPSTPPATTTSTVEDVSGNCDEAEHRLDPECVGGTTTGGTTDERTTDERTTDEATTEADTTTTEAEEEEDSSGQGRGRGRNRGRGGGDD
jgi:hypothetical protein